MGWIDAVSGNMKKKKRRIRSLVSPVALAVVQKHTHDLLVTLGIQAAWAEDGVVDRQMLIDLAWPISVGTQVSLELGDDEQRTRRLHAALRTVIGMAVDGDRWQAAQHQRLYEAAQEANRLVVQHIAIAHRWYASAQWLVERIRSGKIKLSDVAGAELYQKDAA